MSFTQQSVLFRLVLHAALDMSVLQHPMLPLDMSVLHLPVLQPELHLYISFLQQPVLALDVPVQYTVRP
jgi:hypothetical protein